MNIKTLDETDIDAFVAFIENFQNDSRSEEFWKSRIINWWKENPAFEKECIRGWVLLDNQKKIVGFIGDIPFRFILEGREKLVCNGTTWMVEKKYRSQSLLLYKKLLDYSNLTILFNTTPTKNVEEILGSLKFVKYKLNKRSLIITTFSNNSTRIVNRLISSISFFLDFFLKYYFRIKLTKGTSDLYAKILTYDMIDSEFDVLWNKTKNKYLNTLVRNSKTIKWFLKNEFNGKKILIACYDENKIRGFAIYKYVPSKDMSILDFWFDSGQENIIKTITMKAIDFAKEHNIGKMYYSHFNPHVENIFKNIGFFTETIDTRFYYKKTGDSLNQKTTYLSIILGDRDL